MELKARHGKVSESIQKHNGRKPLDRGWVFGK